jgi:hypothetical protein
VNAGLAAVNRGLDAAVRRLAVELAPLRVNAWPWAGFVCQKPGLEEGHARRAGGRADRPLPATERAGGRVTVPLELAGLANRRLARALGVAVHPGTLLRLVIDLPDLLAQAWDENADPFTKTVQVTISRLRRKLGDPPLIQTIPGIGYRITDPDHQPSA